MVLPSVVNVGWVPLGRACGSRLGSPPPAASMRYNCEPPSRLNVAAKDLPSGDQAGALLDPLKFATKRRLPEATSCTKITGLRDSKDTYASCMPLGAHAG